MSKGTLMIIAGALFMGSAGMQFSSGDAGPGAAFIALGAVFIALGARRRKAEGDNARR